MFDAVHCTDCSAQGNRSGPELRAVDAISEAVLFGGNLNSTHPRSI